MKAIDNIFTQKNENYIKTIDFEQAKQIIDSQKASENINKKLLLPRYSIFAFVILLEVLMAASLSGWLLAKPFFALLEWTVVVLTVIYFFKINFKSLAKNYLTRFYSSSSIIFCIFSFVFSLGLWIILLTFSGDTSTEYFIQILAQILISILGVFILGFLIYKYLQYKSLKEISEFIADIKIPLFGKLIDKSMTYAIVIIFATMQFYRINKFWIIGSSSWFTTILIPAVQFVLWLIFFLLLIVAPVRIFYPNFVKNYLLQKYTEEFRMEYGFTKKEWYSG